MLLQTSLFLVISLNICLSVGAKKHWLLDGPMENEREIDGFNNIRGAPRQSSLNAALDSKHKGGKKKAGLFKGIGSMFRFGKHRKMEFAQQEPVQHYQPTHEFDTNANVTPTPSDSDKHSNSTESQLNQSAQSDRLPDYKQQSSTSSLPTNSQHQNSKQQQQSSHQSQNSQDQTSPLYSSISKSGSGHQQSSHQHNSHQQQNSHQQPIQQQQQVRHQSSQNHQQTILSQQTSHSQQSNHDQQQRHQRTSHGQQQNHQQSNHQVHQSLQHQAHKDQYHQREAQYQRHGGFLHRHAEQVSKSNSSICIKKNANIKDIAKKYRSVGVLFLAVKKQQI